MFGLCVVNLFFVTLSSTYDCFGFKTRKRVERDRQLRHERVELMQLGGESYEYAGAIDLSFPSVFLSQWNDKWCRRWASMHSLEKKKLTEVPLSVIKQWHLSLKGFILTHENTFLNLTQLKFATDKTVEEKWIKRYGETRFKVRKKRRFWVWNKAFYMHKWEFTISRL